MFNFYKTKSRWLRVFSAAMFYVLVNSGGLFAQTTYYSKAAATNFGSAASWGDQADGSGAAPGSVSNADNFIIQNGSIMNLTSGSAAVRNLTINAGSLTVASNTLTVSLPTGNNAALVVNSGGTLTASGGTVTLNGSFSLTAGGTLNQSAGTIRIDGNDNNTPASSVPSGTNIMGITATTAANFNLTGGTVWIVDPHVVNSTSLGRAFAYLGSANMALGVGHTFRYGNGASTQGTANVGGFIQETYVGGTRVIYGNLIIDAGPTAPQSLVSQQYTGQWVGVQGDLTITSGDYRNSGTLALVGDLINNGTLTTTGTLCMSNSTATGTIVNSITPSTISGTGVFRNSATVSTANFVNFRIANTTSVTFSNANSLLSGANTGTVSGLTTFTIGTINASAGPFIQGISATSAGTLTWVSGGFGSGTTYRRWMTTSTLTTSITPTFSTASHRFFPFQSGTSSRMALMTKSGNLTTGGWIEATHTNAAGLAAAGFLDGAYTVDQITNASWTFTAGGGLNLGAQSLGSGLCAEGLIVTAAAPGTAPRFVQGAGATKNHAAGSGSTASPFASRVGLVAVDLAGPHYVGINNADIGLYSVASGPWTTGATWSTGTPPTATDNPLITGGTTVTVNAAAATCLTASVSGTLVVSGNTLDVVGASNTGITMNTGGVVTVSGGTLNVGPQDNSFCNRLFSISNGSTVNVTSGNLNVAGRFQLVSGGTLNQSNGTIKLDGNAANVPANSVPAGNIFDVTAATAANFNLTGGTVWIVDPHTLTGTTNRAFGYQGSVNMSLGTGHTFRFGNGASTDGTANVLGFVQETYVGGTRVLYGNLIIDAGPTSPQNQVSQQYTGQFVGVEGNMTITSGEYRNTGTLCVAGNLTNNGILTTTGTLSMSSSTATGTFATSTSPSTISGSGTFQNLVAAPTADVNGFRLQNTHAAGVILGIPLSVSGNGAFAEGKLISTPTNLLSLSSVTGNVSIGTGTAGYVVGPVRRIAPASSTNLGFFFPVGQTGPNWFAIYNLSTNAGGPVTIDVSGDNLLNAPTVFDGSLTAINTGREWTTTIVSGGANMTTYSLQGYDAAMINGNALAGKVGANPFSVIGTGSNWAAAAAPFDPYLTTTLPPLDPGTYPFPDRVGFGTTGPLDVSGATSFQVTGAVARGSSNNDLTRLVVSAIGSSGSITLTDLVWTYTGSNAADIAANGVTLWTGTFAAPVAQVGLGVSLSGGFATFSGMSINIPSGATYLWVRANVSASATIGNVIDGKVEANNMNFSVSGGATFSPPIPAADLDPAGDRLIDYCAPTYASGCGFGDDIVNVALGALNNPSGCTPTPYYTYYSAATVPALQQGSGYTVNVTVGTDGNQYTAVWIDFDQNGVFDASEFFSTGTSAGASGTSAIAITVPGLAPTGITRMRVRGGNDAAITSGQACGASSSGFGETEDYRVNITSPSPRDLSTIVAVQQTGGIGKSTTNNNLLRVDLPTTGSTGTLTLTSMVFSYTGTSTADIAAAGVSLWTGTVSAPSAQVGSSVSLVGGLATFTGLSVALGANNYLWLRVNSSASAVIANLVDAKILAGNITVVAAGGANAPGARPVLELDPAGERFIDYCAPTYASGCGLGDPITNVALNGASINLSNGSACAANPYYTFFNAAPQPDLYQGSTYPISVTLGTDANQWAAAWVDFDQNGIFDASEYFTAAGSVGSNGTAVFNIDVPISATLGNTRMRVRGGDDSQPTSGQACGASNSGFGEAEDYIITVIPPPNCSTLLPFPATTATASTATVCSGSNVVFGITIPMPAGTGITYQWRRNGVNLGAPVATTTRTIAVTLSGNYDVIVLCNAAPQVTSTAVAITVLSPSVTGTTPATRCGPGSLNLAATGSVGTTMKWYTAPSGGAPVSVGPAFPTPPLTTGITPYYVSANQIFGTEAAGKGSIGTGGSFVTNNWGIVFTANSDVVLNSVDVFPFGTGDIVVGLYDASLTLLAETPSTPISGAGATPNTIALGFDVPAGVGYRILVKSYSGITGLFRDNSGLAFPYNSPSGTVSVTSSEWGGTTTGANYFFYNLDLSRSCASARTLVNATVNAAPGLFVNASNPSICSGLTTVALATGAGYTNFVWTPALGVSPAGPGANKTLSPTVTTTYLVTATGGGCNNASNLTITVKPTPTNPVLTPTPAGGQCYPASKNLVASATTGGADVLFSTDFNDATFGGWTLANGGAGPLDWELQTTPLSYAGQITAFSVSSPASPFIWVNSDADAGSDGFSDVISPSFSTLGRSAATLSFDHVYRTVGANIAASVQYSIDGGFTWSSDVYNITATTPAQVWNAASIVTTNTQVVLPAGALNQASVKLRFRIEYSWDYYWMVDNIQVTSPIQVEYRWSANLGFAGIPVPAQTYGVANGNINVNPTAGGALVYTVEVRNTVGCLAASSATHSTNLSQIEIAPSNTGPQRELTNLVISSTATGGFGGYAYQWFKLPDLITPVAATSSFNYPAAVVANSGTYQLTVTDGQTCTATLSTDALVYAALVWNGSQSNNWNDPLNWTPAIVPANGTDCTTPLSRDNVVITNSGTPPVYPGAGIFVDNFGVESGTLDINNNVRVCGSLSGGNFFVGKVIGTGTIELVGTATNIIGSRLELDRLIINKSGAGLVKFQGTTTINDLMTVTAAPGGISVEASGKVILKSTPTTTGKIGPIPGGVALSVTNPGSFSVQRYLPFTVPTIGTQGNWFFLGSPIAGKDFRNWSDDFSMSGYTGSFSTQGGGMITHNDPDRSTVFMNNESMYKGKLDTVQRRGWRVPGGADLIGTQGGKFGKGYRVYVKRYGSQPVIDAEGLINYGNVNLVDLTSTEELSCSDSPTDWCYNSDRGWNLVANPYPCDIDWEANAVAWPKPVTNFSNAYSRWVNNPGISGYGSYVTGGTWIGVVPQPANARYIPSSQSFFVRLDPSGPTYSRTWSITEAAKSVATSGAFARSATSEISMLKIKMTKPELNGSYGFEVGVRFMDQAVDGFDFANDVAALGSEGFYLGMPVENEFLGLNSLAPLTETKTVPMAMNYKGNSGAFVLNFSGISTFEVGSNVYLRDKFFNTLHDVRVSEVYAFNATSVDGSNMTDRFELVFTPAAVTSIKDVVGGLAVAVYPNPSLSGKGTTIAMNGFEAESAQLTIIDAVGRTVFSKVVSLNANGPTEYQLTEELSAGVYTVKTVAGNKSLNSKMVIK